MRVVRSRACSAPIWPIMSLVPSASCLRTAKAQSSGESGKNKHLVGIIAACVARPTLTHVFTVLFMPLPSLMREVLALSYAMLYNVIIWKKVALFSWDVWSGLGVAFSTEVEYGCLSGASILMMCRRAFHPYLHHKWHALFLLQLVVVHIREALSARSWKLI